MSGTQLTFLRRGATLSCAGVERAACFILGSECGPSIVSCPESFRSIQSQAELLVEPFLGFLRTALGQLQERQGEHQTFLYRAIACINGYSQRWQ